MKHGEIKCQGECQEEKPLEAFTLNKNGTRNPACMKCATAKAMKNYKARVAVENRIQQDPFRQYIGEVK